MVVFVVVLAPTYAFAATPPLGTLGGGFTPPHDDDGYDTNGDGLYNFLVVNASFTVDIADVYTVTGFFYHPDDPDFCSYLFNSTSLSLNPGPHVASLFYSGSAINGSGFDGPYTVELGLWDSASNLLDTDVQTTGAYLHTDFEALGAVFTPPFSDHGVDANGDGLFETLNVAVNLTVNAAGTFLTTGLLYLISPGELRLILTSLTIDTLPPGPQTVVLPFSGGAIRASGIDGPYTVSLDLLDLSTFGCSGHSGHDTAPYSYLEFESLPVIESHFASVAPAIDGAILEAEWADAHVEDLTAIPVNGIPARMLVMNDNQSLYVAYDALGDVTMDSFDVASIGFDTGHDGITTDGHDDQFIQGGRVTNNQAHLVYDATLDWWAFEDSPYDPTLPNHAGLASAWGFGPSPASDTDHRIYEFKIPLALLGARPGDTLGFFGGSSRAPGIFGGSDFAWDNWPFWTVWQIPMWAYGGLVLAGVADVVPPTISITSPPPPFLEKRKSVTVSWTASDTGWGLDHFEVRVDRDAEIMLPADARSHTVTGLSDGSHTIEITVFDRAGYSESDSVTFVVDTVPPVVTIVSPMGNFLGSSTIDVKWTVLDTGTGAASIRVSLDDREPVTLHGSSTSHTFADVPDGTHTARVSATDAAGNIASATATVTIDTIAPNLEIVSPTGGTVLHTPDTSISFTRDDAGSGIDRIELRVDNALPVTLGSAATSHELTSLPDGEHELTITVYDRAGNAATRTVRFRVDTSFLSPSGPYGYGGLGVIAAIVLVASGIAVMAAYSRRRKRPPIQRVDGR